MASTNVNTTPWFASSALTSDEMRYALASLTQSSSGVTPETGVFPSGDGLNVTRISNTSVRVAAGACVVQTAVSSGAYIVPIPVPYTVTVTAGVTNPRIDLLCVRVMDNEAGDGLGAPIQARLLTVEGTAGANPSAPGTPTGYLVLAHLRVTSTNLVVTDKRTYTRASGGSRMGTTTDTRDGAYPGDTRVWGNGQIDVWTGSDWVAAAAPSVWSSTPNWTWSFSGANAPDPEVVGPAGNVNFGAGRTSIVRWKRAGNDLTVSYAVRYGTSPYGGGTGNLTTLLPPGMFATADRDHWIPCQLWVNNSDANVKQDWGGMAVVLAGENVVRPYFPWNTGDKAPGLAPHKIANNDGVAGKSVPFTGNTGFAQGGTIHIGPGIIEVQ